MNIYRDEAFIKYAPFDIDSIANEYCLSPRFHLSRVVIALQASRFRAIESGAMSPRKWMLHRESSAGSFASLQSNLFN